MISPTLLLAGLLAVPTAPPASDPAADLAWVPSDQITLSHAAGDGVALLTFARGSLRDGRPACLDRLTGPGVRHVTFSRFVGDKGVNAVHGLSGGRDAIEACAAQVFQQLTGQAVTYERDGAITRATSKAGERYLAWRDDGWLFFHHDRARVEPLLRRPASPTLAPALRPFLKRVSLAEPYWWLYPGDLTEKLLGVRSKAVVMRVARPAGAPAGPGPIVATFTFFFNGQAEAVRGAAAVSEAARDDAFHPKVRAALQAMRPAVRGAELKVDISQFFADPETMEAVTRLIQAHLGL